MLALMIEVIAFINVLLTFSFILVEFKAVSINGSNSLVTVTKQVVEGRVNTF